MIRGLELADAGVSIILAGIPLLWWKQLPDQAKVALGLAAVIVCNVDWILRLT